MIEEIEQCFRCYSTDIYNQKRQKVLFAICKECGFDHGSNTKASEEEREYERD